MLSKYHRQVAFYACVLLVVAFSGLSIAQTGLGRIQGFVFDEETGESIANATVKYRLAREETYSAGTYTNSEGEFVTRAFPTGCIAGAAV